MGWHYTQKPNYRRTVVYNSTNRRQSKYNRYIEAAKKMMAVVNVAQNSSVKQTAKADADYFYAMTKRMQGANTNQTKQEIDRNFDKWSDEYMKAWGGK